MLGHGGIVSFDDSVDMSEQAQFSMEFCKIEFNDNSLDFNKNEKLFSKTYSFLQVRKQIAEYEDKKYQPYYYLLNNK